MVACAAVSVQQLSCRDWMQPQSAGCCASVDQLKQQLLEAVENDNLDEANDVIVKLEKCGMTKEILEVRDALAARPAYRSEWCALCAPLGPHRTIGPPVPLTMSDASAFTPPICFFLCISVLST
ncbi:hypothetical protein Tcan_16647 [Toxocara canis]|uniref:Uncharacterized protein n=1 Tax=Toxocara canis TaxID=6265 RepID=A0A0B2VSQ2_TOXCA|nr:hypothetical protein Tcan_16647 [Toxocara canis]